MLPLVCRFVRGCRALFRGSVALLKGCRALSRHLVTPSSFPLVCRFVNGCTAFLRGSVAFLRGCRAHRLCVALLTSVSLIITCSRTNQSVPFCSRVTKRDILMSRFVTLLFIMCSGTNQSVPFCSRVTKRDILIRSRTRDE